MPKKLTKILIVEDDHYMRKIYSNKLRRARFEVIEAIQGEEGWHKILYEQPDLIILDLILPMKSGFQLLSDIKGNDKTKKIPVIILTNLSQGSDIQKGKDLGADDYLVKTDISLTEVVDKVKMVLAKQR